MHSAATHKAIFELAKISTIPDAVSSQSGVLTCSIMSASFSPVSTSSGEESTNTERIKALLFARPAAVEPEGGIMRAKRLRILSKTK